jgi:ubiquinone biosynthesis protein UbiJ
MPSMRILDYTIRDTAQNVSAAIPATDYATKADLDTLKNQIESLKMRLGKLTKKEAENE